MKATLYVPYSNGDCVNGFQSDRGEIPAQQYAKLVVDEHYKFRDGIDSTVRARYSQNMSINTFEKIKNKYKQQTFYYNDCPCHVYNIEEQDATIDELIRYFQTKEQFILILALQNMKENPDLETDMKMWTRESMKITRAPQLTEEEKILNLPKKDFKIKFIDAKSCAILKECKLLEMRGQHVYAIVVNNIIFVRDK